MQNPQVQGNTQLNSSVPIYDFMNTKITSTCFKLLKYCNFVRFCSISLYTSPKCYSINLNQIYLLIWKLCQVFFFYYSSIAESVSDLQDHQRNHNSYRIRTNSQTLISQSSGRLRSESHHTPTMKFHE